MIFKKFFRRKKNAAPEGSCENNEMLDADGTYEEEGETEKSDGVSGEENTEEKPIRMLLGSRAVVITGIVAGISLILSLIFLISPDFAELYSRTVGGFIRMVLAKITGIFPFSLAETLTFSFIVYVVYSIIRSIYEAVKNVENEKRFEIWSNRVIVCVLLTAYSLYNFSFASCGFRYDLEDNLGLDRKPLTAQQLYECIVLVEDEISECLDSGDIRHTPDGASCLPYSYNELNAVLNNCYENAYEKYDFLNRFNSTAKRLAISPIMTYTHISGIYIPYTGEVNINTNYPDYVIAFSEAHEMAHQRGIAREDEANFVAFLIMYESDDNYLRYCALTELFDYLADALYQTDEELFYSAAALCDIRLLEEIFAFSDFFAPYSNSTASVVMEVVNDTSIKLRGDSDGAKSYDMMIELAAAYFGIE